MVEQYIDIINWGVHLAESIFQTRSGIIQKMQWKIIEKKYKITHMYIVYKSVGFIAKSTWNCSPKNTLSRGIIGIKRPFRARFCILEGTVPNKLYIASKKW